MSEQPAKYITECRICRQQFEARPFVAQINAATPDPRLMKFGAALFQHMALHHQELMGAFLIVTCFQLQDPVLVSTLDGLRHQVNWNTRKNWVTDENIQDRLAGLGFDEATIKTLQPVMQDLRDFISENGAHGPQEQPSVLVTA